MSNEIRTTVWQVLDRVNLSPARLAQRTNWVSAVIDLLLDDPDTMGLLFGGSLLRGRADEWSDCDFFSIVKEHAREKRDALLHVFGAFDDVRICFAQPSYPWFGELLTTVFNDDYYFSIDVGLVTSIDARDFFWEPSGLVLDDPCGIIQDSIARRRTSHDQNPFGPRMPLTTLTLLALKVRKSLIRGSLWNAIEYVQQSRRSLFFMLRALLQEDSYLGKPDKYVERALQREELERLQQTCPTYSEDEIGRATSRIMRWALEIAEVAKFDGNPRIFTELKAACQWFEENYK